MSEKLQLTACNCNEKKNVKKCKKCKKNVTVVKKM